MGRNREIGLSYFPFDVDTFSDIKIRKLIKRQGGKAFTVYAFLLCLIYKSGYYMRWDEELPFIVSEQTGFDEAYILEVIKICLALGLFSKEVWESKKVLTSKGIQTRYAEAMNFFRRKTEIREFNLISSEENGISATFIGINAEKTPRKEKKGKEKKETNFVGKEKLELELPEEDFLEEKNGCVEKSEAGQIDTAFESEKNSGGGVADFSALARRPFDENVRECMDSPQWQQDALTSAGFSGHERAVFSQEDWRRYFGLFRGNIGAYGYQTEMTLREFRGHFTNWLRIQHDKQIKNQSNGTKEKMVGDERAGGRAGFGRPEITSAAKVPFSRGKSVL